MYVNAIAALTTGSSILESFFYSSLRPGPGESPRIVKWVREQAIGRYLTLQNLFSVVNFGSALYCLKMLDDTLIRRYAFSLVGPEVFFIFLGVSAAVFFGSIVYSYFSPRKEGGKKQPVLPGVQEMKISEEPIDQQQLARIFHGVRFVATFALACFSGKKIWQIPSMATTLYNFFRCSQVRWMNFSRRFNFPAPLQFPRAVPEPGVRPSPLLPAVITSVEVTYSMMALGAKASDAGSDCAICLEPMAKTAFCVHHLFHENCLSSLVGGKSQSFLGIEKYHSQDVHHYNQHGFYQRTTRHYSVEISKKNLPICPCCRVAPPNNHFSVTVTDPNYGEIPATVTMIP